MKMICAFLLVVTGVNIVQAQSLEDTLYELWQNDQYNEIVKEAGPVINSGSMSEESMIALFYRGVAYFELGKYVQANDDLESIASGMEGYSTFLYWLALSREKLGKQGEALSALNTYLNRYPDEEYAIYHRALVYEKLGDYKHALSDIEKAISLDDRNSYRIARIRLVLRRFGFAAFIKALPPLVSYFSLLIPPLLWLSGFLLSLTAFLFISARKADNTIKYQLYARIARMINLVAMFVFLYMMVELDVLSSFFNLILIFGVERRIIMYLLMALMFSVSYFLLNFCTSSLTGYAALKKWRGLAIPFGRQLKLGSTTFIYAFMIQTAIFSHALFRDAIGSYGMVSTVISIIAAAALVLLIMTFYPKIIALFYGIDRELSAALTSYYADFLAESGVKIKKITVIKTSDIRMANAWVSGIGFYSMVITDYLVRSFSPDEMKGVLSHEIGHIRKRHLLINYSFVLFWLFSSSLISKYISDNILVYLAYMLFCFVVLFNFISRKFEYQADNYAVNRTGEPEVFIGALAKIGKKNWMPLKLRKAEEKTMTHPTIEKRIARIRQDFMTEKAAPEGI